MADNTILKYYFQKKQKESDRRWQQTHDMGMAGYKQQLDRENEDYKDEKATSRRNELLGVTQNGINSQDIPDPQKDPLGYWIVTGKRAGESTGQSQQGNGFMNAINKFQGNLSPGVSVDLGDGMRVSGKENLSPNQKIFNKATEKDVLSLAQLLPKLSQAEAAVNQLEAQWNRGASPVSVKPGSNVALGSATKFLSGAKNYISASSGTNPELRTYLADRGAFSSLISKGGFLEAGMLTNQDIGRVLQALPGRFTTKEESNAAWREIKSIMSSARQRFEQKKGSLLQGEGGDNFSSLFPDSGSATSNQQSEEDLVAEALASEPGSRNAILRKYKENTGRDYRG